jgi:hypothetical protein
MVLGMLLPLPDRTMEVLRWKFRPRGIFQEYRETFRDQPGTSLGKGNPWLVESVCALVHLLNERFFIILRRQVPGLTRLSGKRRRAEKESGEHSSDEEAVNEVFQQWGSEDGHQVCSL